MTELLSTLQKNVLHTLQTLQSEEALMEYKNTILGKTGELTLILKGLKDLSVEERSSIGKLANECRDILSEAFEREKLRIKSELVAKRLQNEWTDLTLPKKHHHGSIHPITQIQQKVEDTFIRMGFEVYESMEVTTEYLNFDGVNIPKTHPARDMQDTFWLEGEHAVLATQTSCMQNLILKNKKLPIRAVIP
jgi:phenylalanyl-tRNA synthetase alpha chain